MNKIENKDYYKKIREDMYDEILMVSEKIDESLGCKEKYITSGNSDLIANIESLLKDKPKNPRRELNSFILQPSSKSNIDLIFTDDSLFTKSFCDEIQKVLGKNPESFRKKTAKQKYLVSKKLESLLRREKLWNTLVKKSRNNTSDVKAIYPTEIVHFRNIYKDNFFRKPGETDYVAQKYGAAKMVLFYQGLVNCILKSNQLKATIGEINLEAAKNLNEQDFKDLVRKIETDKLFCELVRISMKNAYDGVVDVEHTDKRKFNTIDSVLQAKRQDIQYSFNKFILMYGTSQILELFTKKKIIRNDLNHRVSVMRYIDKYFSGLSYSQVQSPMYNWLYYAHDVAIILIEFFIVTDVVTYAYTQQSYKNRTSKNQVILVFDSKLDNSLVSSKHLPRIYPPKKAESQKCVADWLRVGAYGISDIQVSEKAIASLNIAQRKEFVVNEKFVELLEEVDKREHCDQFPTEAAFKKKRDVLDSWEKSAWINVLSLSFYFYAERYIKAKRNFDSPEKEDEKSVAEKSDDIVIKDKDYDLKELTLHRKIVNIIGVSDAECYMNVCKNNLRNEMLTMRATRQLFKTSISICKIVAGFPLYYSTLLDFRLRMYPLQYLLSRTTGYLKNLIQESKPRKLSKAGLYNMLDAYYSPSTELSSKFKSTEKFTRKTLCEFFLTNKLSDRDKDVLYFELLEKEIEDVVKGQQKTSMAVEIDQVGSGPTLVALVTGNRKLAEKCNLLGGPFNCVYKYLMAKAKIYISSDEFKQNKIENITDAHKKALHILTEDRKAQKMALMCFIYNESAWGRTARWKDDYIRVFGEVPDKDNYALLSAFSNKYDDFLEFVFPNLTKQLNILNKAMLEVVNADQPVQVKTLDDCFVSWDFENTVSQPRSVYNSIAERHESYRVNIIADKDYKDRDVSFRRDKHRTSFRPNFIHSVDASLMRMFIYEFYKKTRRRLNHLHDCVMLHPNDVEIFYGIVTDIYCDPRMLSLAQDLVFSRFINNTTGKTRDNLLELQEEFVGNMEPLPLNISEFDPKKCYRYEGAK